MKNKVKKQKDKSLKKLIKYCRPFVFLIILTLLCGLIGITAQIIGPNQIQRITNLIIEGLYGGYIDVEKITPICIFLVCLFAVGAIFYYLSQYLTTIITQKVVKKLRKDVSIKINNVPLDYFDKHLHGDLLSRVTNDIDTIGQSLDESVGSLSINILMFLGVLIMMFITEPIMAITAIIATFIGFMFSLIFISKSQKYFIETQENLGELNAHIEEVYSGQNVIKLYNAEDKTKEKFDQINKKFYKSGWKSQFISGIMGPLMGFVGNFGYVAVCIVGGILAAKRGIEYFGVIAAFMIYIRLFSNPLSQMAQSITFLQSASAASNRVFSFLEEKELENEDNKNIEIKNVIGNVEFNHIKFGYNSDKIIIKDFSQKIKAGQKVAIVGPTGAGKTTIVNLLMKFYELNSGDIKIEGVSIKDLRREQIHSYFGMVLQDTWLFQGTVKENLKYNSNVNDEEIKEICKIIGIDHFIQTLPNGYDTIIDDTLNISSGQKQLLTIARTMLANKPMVILDEATSSVDTRTEELLQKAMDKIMEGKTSFIIAHRLSTIKNADLILVLKDGDIIEKGKHNELIKEKGFYYELYNSQFDSI